MPSERITPGGTAITARAINCTNWPINTATAGTDVTPSTTTTYYTSVVIPGDMFITNIIALWGSASTNGLAVLAIYNEAGAVLANTALAGTATTTAAQTQAIPLTTPFLLTGPRYAIVALQMNSASDRFRAVPAFCGGGILAGSQTGTVFGTLPTTLTISATNFTADKAPIISFS